MEDLLKAYISYLDTCKISKSTKEAYISDITDFLNYIAEINVSIDSIDTLIVMSYIQRRNEIASSSLQRKMVVIRNFCRFLIVKGILSKDPTFECENIKVNHKAPKTLSLQEVNLLLSAPDLNTVKGIRDKAMLETMYASGVKVSELLDLKVTDINLELNYLNCTGSNKKERIIPLGSYAVDYVNAYLKYRDSINVSNKSNLFLSLKGERMTRQAFWKMIKAYAKIAKIEKEIDSSTLRNSFAVHLLQNGADIKSLQEFLGFKEAASIQRYADATEKLRLAEVYKNSHPRA